MSVNTNWVYNTPVIHKSEILNYINVYISKKNNRFKPLTCDDYLCKLYIENKDHNKIFLEEKRNKKISNHDFRIPMYHQYNLVNEYNYTLEQLKIIAKDYQIKMSGNKQQLTTRIITFLYFSNYAIKIQSVARLYLQKKYNASHGPAFMNRNICVNTYDFLSMDELSDIPYSQFFSYKDEDDGLIYGFDLLSLYNLLYKSVGTIKNPFNRKSLTPETLRNFRELIRISHVFKIPIVTEIKNEPVACINEQLIGTRITQLFHNIDLLGNYSESSWFTSLNKEALLVMMHQLFNMWQYRAGLSLETRRSIFPPMGIPFFDFNFDYVKNLENINDVRSRVLNVLERLVNTGITQDFRALGAFYVLGSLTLVNIHASQALPWLFEAVCHM